MTATDPGLAFASPPGELCLVRLSAIGDTCHTVPVVRAIQRAWPETRITWIIGKVEHALMAGLENVEFAVLDKSAGMRGYLNVRRQLAGRRFPLLLHMHASLRASRASLMARAKIRLGFDKARARDYQWYFCNRHIRAVANQHVMDGLLGFAAAIGVQDLTPRWDIPVADSDRKRAAELVDAKPTLVISPCTGQRFRNYRNWSIDNYAAVADYASSRYGARVLITGGNSDIEAAYAEGIVDRTECIPKNLVGKTSLKELLAIIDAASVVLCPDSGPAHMSTAVGTPVVGLYATSNPARTGPWGSMDLVVNKYPQAVRAEFDKSVEELRFGQRVRNPEAMSLIRVSDVIDKLDRAFARAGKRAANHG